MFFTLDYIGHPNAKVLNGGLNAWKANGGAIEIGPAPKVAIAALTPKPQPDRVVSADWIKERLSSPKMTLLDARPDNEFTGADGGMNGAHVKGHLPDAQQLVWNTLLDSTGKFLPDAELRKKFEAIGANAGHAARELLHGRHARVGHVFRRASPRLRRAALRRIDRRLDPAASCRR